MKESKAVYVTRHHIRDDQKLIYDFDTSCYRHYTPRRTERYDDYSKSKEFACQFDSKRDICKCRNVFMRDAMFFSQLSNQVYEYHGSRSFTAVGVGSVKALPRRRVKRVYLPETDDRGVGSSDLSACVIRKTRPLKSSYYDQITTSSKCVGGILEYNTGCVISEKLSPILNTKSGTTSPKEPERHKNIEIGSNTVLKKVKTIGTQFEIDEKEEKVTPKNEEPTLEVMSTLACESKITYKNSSSIKKSDSKIKEVERQLSSDSLVQHVHDLEVPGVDKQSRETALDPMENKLEREYRHMFDANDSKPCCEKPDFKSASLLRRRFDALRKGLTRKDDLKKSSFLPKSSQSREHSREITPSHKDASVTSDPPSLEGRSFSDTKRYSPIPANIIEQDRPKMNRRSEKETLPFNSTTESDCQGVKGMFKLWGKKFNLEEDRYKLPTPMLDCVVPNKLEKEVEKKEGVKKKPEPEAKKEKRFFFFNKKSKEKPIESCKKKPKDVTAGRCEINDGLTLKMGKLSVQAPVQKEKYSKAPKEREEITRKRWLRRYLSSSIESAGSVNVRWNSTTYTTSSSTIFELLDTVYKNTEMILRSLSDVTSMDSCYKSNMKNKVNFTQDIEAWMIPKTIPDKRKEIPVKIRPKNNIKQKRIQLSNFNQKWLIDESQALSHKIEVVLHSKNENVKRNVSSGYLKIDIPKGFFDDLSSDESKRNQTSDEEVYKIVEYETDSDCKNVKRYSRIENGDNSQSDIRVIVSVQDSNRLESKILETIIKRPPSHRDVIIQGSNVVIPKRCAVIGVGIITQRDLREIRKPILKIQTISSSEDSDPPPPLKQNKCKFAESYLQEYYKTWTPLGLDFSAFVSDSHLQSCSEKSLSFHNQQGDNCKSCPNICDDYQASAIISSCETSSCCVDYNKATDSKKQSRFFSFMKKTNKNCNKTKICNGFRTLPKDSLVVFKNRKLYAQSNKGQWHQSEDKPVSVPSIDSKEEQECRDSRKRQQENEARSNITEPAFESNGDTCPLDYPLKEKSMTKKKGPKKHVSMANCEIVQSNIVQKQQGNVGGILAYKGSSVCETCKKKLLTCLKHASISVKPSIEIPPQPCKAICEEQQNPPCDRAGSPSCNISISEIVISSASRPQPECCPSDKGSYVSPCNPPSTPKGPPSSPPRTPLRCPPSPPKCDTPCLPSPPKCDTPCPPSPLICDPPCPPSPPKCDTPCPPSPLICDPPCPPNPSKCDTPCPPSPPKCDTPCRPSPLICDPPCPPSPPKCDTLCPPSPPKCDTPYPPCLPKCDTPCPPCPPICNRPSPSSPLKCNTPCPQQSTSSKSSIMGKKSCANSIRPPICDPPSPPSCPKCDTPCPPSPPKCDTPCPPQSTSSKSSIMGKKSCANSIRPRICDPPSPPSCPKCDTPCPPRPPKCDTPCTPQSTSSKSSIMGKKSCANSIRPRICDPPSPPSSSKCNTPCPPSPPKCETPCPPCPPICDPPSPPCLLECNPPSPPYSSECDSPCASECDSPCRSISDPPCPPECDSPCRLIKDPPCPPECVSPCRPIRDPSCQPCPFKTPPCPSTCEPPPEPKKSKQVILCSTESPQKSKQNCLPSPKEMSKNPSPSPLPKPHPALPCTSSESTNSATCPAMNPDASGVIPYCPPMPPCPGCLPAYQQPSRLQPPKSNPTSPNPPKPKKSNLKLHYAYQPSAKSEELYPPCAGMKPVSGVSSSCPSTLSMCPHHFPPPPPCSASVPACQRPSRLQPPKSDPTSPLPPKPKKSSLKLHYATNSQPSSPQIYPNYTAMKPDCVTPPCPSMIPISPKCIPYCPSMPPCPASLPACQKPKSEELYPPCAAMDPDHSGMRQPCPSLLRICPDCLSKKTSPLPCPGSLPPCQRPIRPQTACAVKPSCLSMVQQYPNCVPACQRPQISNNTSISKKSETESLCPHCAAIREELARKSSYPSCKAPKQKKIECCSPPCSLCASYYRKKQSTPSKSSIMGKKSCANSIRPCSKTEVKAIQISRTNQYSSVPTPKTSIGIFCKIMDVIKSDKSQSRKGCSMMKSSEGYFPNSTPPLKDYESQCPSNVIVAKIPQNSCAKKLTGIFLRKKSSKKKNSTKESSAWECEPLEPGIIKINSQENITIKLKQQSPSTEAIREGVKVKVQDIEERTSSERRDYSCGKNKSSIIGNIYDAKLDRLSTPVIVTDLTSDTQQDVSNTKSEQSLGNLVEIQFKLRIIHGDKTTEIKIGKKEDQEEKKEVIENSPQVYPVKDVEIEELTDEGNPKNDINIKIVVNNYKKNFKTTEKRKSEMDNQPVDDYYNKISNKFNSVSTGYSDICTQSAEENENVFSVHRTTINLTSSTEKYETYCVTSNERPETHSAACNERSKSRSAVSNERCTIHSAVSIEKSTIHSDVSNERSTIHSAVSNEQSTMHTDRSNERIKIHSDVSNERITIHSYVSNEKIKIHSDVSNERCLFCSAVSNERIQIHSDVSNERIKMHSDVSNERSKSRSTVSNERSTIHSDVSNERSTIHSDVSNERIKIHNDVSNDRLKIQSLASNDFDESVEPIEQVASNTKSKSSCTVASLSTGELALIIEDEATHNLKTNLQPYDLHYEFLRETYSSYFYKAHPEKLRKEPEISVAVISEEQVEFKKKQYSKMTKKELLKRVFQRAHSKPKNKSRVRKLREMLKIILTDSSTNDELCITGNEPGTDVALTSLKPNDKDTDSMKNYYKLESTLSSLKLESSFFKSNNNPKNENNSHETEDDSGEASPPYTGCMCSRVVEKIKDPSVNLRCFCGQKSKQDGEVNCDIYEQTNTITSIDNETQIPIEHSKVNINKSTNIPLVVITEAKQVSTNIIEKLLCPSTNKTGSQISKHTMNDTTMLDFESNNEKLKKYSNNTNSESKRTERENIFKHRNAADILQCYETKKAVLEIYAEKIYSEHGEHLVAKLPKFLYEKESEIERNYDKIATNSYMSVCTKSVER